MTPLPIELGRNLDINNRGEISGERFVYADGQLHDVPAQIIGTPCWRSFVIQDINDHGDLAVLVRRCPVGDEDPGRDAIILTMNPERYTQ
jgi:hypothetical protein